MIITSKNNNRSKKGGGIFLYEIPVFPRNIIIDDEKVIYPETVPVHDKSWNSPDHLGHTHRFIYPRM